MVSLGGPAFSADRDCNSSAAAHKCIKPASSPACTGGSFPVLRNSVSGPLSLATLPECSTNGFKLTGGPAADFKFTGRADQSKLRKLSRSQSSNINLTSEGADVDTPAGVAGNGGNVCTLEVGDVNGGFIPGPVNKEGD